MITIVNSTSCTLRRTGYRSIRATITKRRRECIGECIGKRARFHLLLSGYARCMLISGRTRDLFRRISRDTPQLYVNLTAAMVDRERSQLHRNTITVLYRITFRAYLHEHSRESRIASVLTCIVHLYYMCAHSRRL